MIQICAKEYLDYYKSVYEGFRDYPKISDWK